MADWIKGNYTSVIDWGIALAAILIPLLLARQGRDKITNRQNLLKTYISVALKISFFYLALVCIFFWAGSFLRVPDYMEQLDKRTYLCLCIVLGFGFSLVTTRAYHQKAWAGSIPFLLMAAPVFSQFVLYIAAIIWKPSSYVWSFSWAVSNFFWVSAATVLLDDRDFFAYNRVLLYWKDGEAVHRTPPDRVARQGRWIVVEEDPENRVKYPAESVKKLQYFGKEPYRAPQRMGHKEKLLSLGLSLWYFLVISLAGQLLLNSVIIPISVTETEVRLEPGDYYQIGAVSLDQDAGQLEYTVQGDGAIAVSPSGMVTVGKDFPEGLPVTAKIKVSDQLGNSAVIRVQVPG